MNNFNRLLEGIHRTPKPISKAKMKELRKKYKLSPDFKKKMDNLDVSNLDVTGDYTDVSFDIQQAMDTTNKFRRVPDKAMSSGRVRQRPRRGGPRTR